MLEGGELPGQRRMVHAQTPSGTENLTRASDLQEYADTIPIHRLQFLHNNSTIVLVDVQTSTFHIRLMETRRRMRTASQSFFSLIPRLLGAIGAGKFEQL